MKTVKISDINSKFGGNSAPKDEKMIELLKEAYSGKLLAQVAMIKIEGIKPFSDFKPQISNEFRSYFEELEKQGNPPPLYVYPKDGYFVMSDDYNGYHLYMEKNYQKIVCVVLGDADGSLVLEKSEPFQLPLPTSS